MKYKLILSAAALSLLLPGIAYSQQEQEKEKPQQEEHQKAETETHQQTDRTQQDTKKQEEETRKQQQDANKQTQHEQKDQANTERRQQTEERKTTEVQRSEVKQEHGRIPDDKFRASFGREHTFRVERRDDRRFQYGGYWFTYSEPWPVAWAYTDAVYVDFIDGQYYLIDVNHPGVRLLLVVG
ncbi:MAG TPA: hypothetical protein VK795_08195 [Terriglobales bacterium]|jgi:hypothetical protein|nr:hypothetical protein [Terriglobales bacterium]